jgi:hypothetical protein
MAPKMCVVAGAGVSVIGPYRLATASRAAAGRP